VKGYPFILKVSCVDLHNLFHQDEEAREHKDGNVQMSYKYIVLDVDCVHQDLVYISHLPRRV